MNFGVCRQNTRPGQQHAEAFARDTKFRRRADPALRERQSREKSTGSPGVTPIELQGGHRKQLARIEEVTARRAPEEGRELMDVDHGNPADPERPDAPGAHRTWWPERCSQMEVHVDLERPGASVDARVREPPRVAKRSYGHPYCPDRRAAASSHKLWRDAPLMLRAPLASALIVAKAPLLFSPMPGLKSQEYSDAPGGPLGGGGIRRRRSQGFRGMTRGVDGDARDHSCLGVGTNNTVDRCPPLRLATHTKQRGAK